MKLEQSYPTVHIWVIAFCFMLITFFNLYPLLQTETLRTDWTMTFAEEGVVFQTGKAFDLHFILEDERDEALNGATVTAVFDRLETIHHIEKTLANVGDGLYETEVVFSLPGTWIAMVEAKKGGSIYRNQFIFTVEGAIVAKEHRDPNDHFHLKQRLPIEIERELEKYRNSLSLDGNPLQ